VLEKELSSSKLYVKKFGGTSVGSIARIEHIADKVAKAFFEGERQVIVLSAMAGETNRLFALAGQVDPKAHARELDMLVSTGEQVSIALMAMALHKRGVKAKSLTGDQVQIHTNSQFGRASIESVDTDYLQALLSQGVIPVVAGFQGRDSNGEMTTLGRGGSDTTAVALAAALSADECQIFTDVTGVFTTDPNIEPGAQKLDAISFEVMYEMARLGAKVLHPDSVSYAERFKVPLRVLSSFEPGEGTLIQFAGCAPTKAKIVGIATSKSLALVSLQGLKEQDDACAQLFHQLAQLGVDIDLMTKTQHESQMLSFTLAESALEQVLSELDALSSRLDLGPVYVEQQLARISLVADGTLAMAEVAASVFDTLGKQGIHVKLLSTSEIKLSVVIAESDLHFGVRALHQALALDRV
jgi:aspartate kinase